MQATTKLGGEFRDESDPSISPALREINELIRLAQNKTGSVPRQKRDEAIMQLCNKFANLIKKTAKTVHRKANNIDFDEWYHDTITTFIELVIDDYRLKEDGGQAFFGTYIVQKLYFRMLDKSQRSVSHYSRMGIFDASLAQGLTFSNAHLPDIGIDADGKTRRAIIRDTPTEVFNSMTANFRGSDEPVVNEDRREQIIEEAQMIIRLARKVLKPREFDIFTMHYASGMIAKDIEPLLTPKISASRIRFIARKARDRVLLELGKQRIGGALT